jgi:transcriptional regulator with XRE-family HTH domain
VSPAAVGDKGGPVDLGARLRTARQEAGLSMRALARESGVSQPFLSLVERGQSAPSISTLYRIAAALGITPVELMAGDRIETSRNAASVLCLRSGSGRRLPVSEASNSAVGTVLSSTADLEVVEYRIAPGEDLGDWFSSSGTQNLTVIEGRLRVELEGLGEWDLSSGDSLTHPSQIRHRWSVGTDEGAHLMLAVARQV